MPENPEEAQGPSREICNQELDAVSLVQKFIELDSEFSSDSDLVRAWLDHRRGEYSDNTIDTYETDIRQARDFFLDERGIESLANVTQEDILAWKECLKDEVTLETGRRRISSLKSLFRFAVREQYIPFNPGREVRSAYKAGPDMKERKRQERRRKEKYQSRLTVRETHKMFEAAKSKRNELLMKVMYKMALRVSEAIELYFEDFKPHPSSEEHAQVRVVGKCDRERTITVPKDLWRQLQEWKEEQNKDDEDPVFESQRGGTLNRKSVYRFVKDAALRIGIDRSERPVSPHFFRRSVASHLAKKNVPISDIQSLLGHKYSMTTDGYIDADEDEPVTDIL